MRNKNNYLHLLQEIKSRVRKSQYRAASFANAEMITMYWDIGRMIAEQQELDGWGAKVIPSLSNDIKNGIPEVKGFSERNIKRMLSFYRIYPNLGDTLLIVPTPLAQLEGEPNSWRLLDLVLHIPWSHNVLLMEKIKDISTREWYAKASIEAGLGVRALGVMINNQDHLRAGSSINNFQNTLAQGYSEIAQKLLKDPYIFDFLTLTETFQERELESELVLHVEKFLLELGQGFTFVGRQYEIEVSNREYYLDLLFYHLKLRSYIVVELKKGEFKPEYAGKMNFYCSIVDDKLRQEEDQPTIGLILCQTKDKIVAEYSLRDMLKPIGVSEYELTRALPDKFKSSLPSVEEIEAELLNI